ncbi:MAG: hypothetical protein KF764_31790 [Labilithrix sp.]|nr:hypothetical protein [Labilithrix sp.]
MAMAEPGTPKSARQEPALSREGGAKLVSRIESRPASSQAPPAGARAIPTRNPKAPLPPRVSHADPLEVAGVPSSSGVIEPRRPTLSPESPRVSPSKPPALPTARASQAPRPPPPALSGREDAETAAALPNDVQHALAQLQRPRDPGVDPAHALAQLQRQRESGAPAPPPPPASRPSLAGPETQRLGADSPRRLASASPLQPVVPSTKSITSPLGALNLKPGGAPLSAGRTPAPMAIVSGSSLRINGGPERPMMPSRPPTNEAFVPPAIPMPYPAPASTMKGLAPSVPPSAPSSRPVTGPVPWTPSSPPATSSGAPSAGGPPASYERAFRQWSSPAIEEAPGPGGPVTFQVYTAQDISTGRGPVRSPPAVAPEPKKASLGLRIGMIVTGSIVVLLTAAAVVAVSTEDPKRPAPSTNVAVTTETPSVVSAPEPPPSTISIGDPVDDSEPTPTAAPAPTVTLKAKPKASAAQPAPSSLKSIAPPPNPYGN